MAIDRRGQKQKGRRGFIFSLRLTDDEREQVEQLQTKVGGPPKLGPWLVWRALHPDGYYPGDRSGNTLPGRGPGPGNTDAGAVEVIPELSDRLILDLCAGSGSWSAPYRAAGYRVQLVTLPETDVRTWTPPDEPVWGILAAPPCTQFSMARNGCATPRNYVEGMEVVNACMRIILQCRPRWWALENPVGKLSGFLGIPRDSWEPTEFGDPWTKRTAIWGDYTIPTRGPYVPPLGGGPDCRICDRSKRAQPRCSNPDHVAVTPPGFAQAFYRANP